MGVGATVGFLSGSWHVVREIADRRTGQDGVFRGVARFVPAESGQVLEYAEQGELRFGGHRGPATRMLRYRGRPDGSADVRFADGREFYRLDLSAGLCAAVHWCRADRYSVTVTRLTDDTFTEVWQVAGPDKDYELRTTYRRSAMENTGSAGSAA